MKNLQHFPETLQQAIMQSQHEIVPSDAIFVFRFSAARAQKESEYQGNKSTNQTKVSLAERALNLR